HEPPLERGQHTGKVVAPFEHCAMLSDQRKCPLLQSKRGAFFDAHIGPFRVPAEGGEHCDLGIDPKRIIAPVARRDHSSIEIEDSGQFLAVESGDRTPVPNRRERRDDTQALFTFGCGCRAALSTFSSLRSASSSCSSSLSRARVGSTSSPHGVPYGTNPGL